MYEQMYRNLDKSENIFALPTAKYEVDSTNLTPS